MNTEIKLQDYLTELSSSLPTPGGGNVAALSAVLGCSLGIMVCNLTIGKKKYQVVEESIKSLQQKLEVARKDFLKLAEEDNQAFNKVMDAYKLPKETDDEKNKRNEKINEATFEAAVVPSRVIETCRLIVPAIEEVSQKGNQNSLSDIGVAASLFRTASEGAFLNVLINCSSLSNKTYAVEFLKKSEVANEEVKLQCENILSKIKKSLTKY